MKEIADAWCLNWCFANFFFPGKDKTRWGESYAIVLFLQAACKRETTFKAPPHLLFLTHQHTVVLVIIRNSNFHTLGKKRRSKRDNMPSCSIFSIYLMVSWIFSTKQLPKCMDYNSHHSCIMAKEDESCIENLEYTRFGRLSSNILKQPNVLSAITHLDIRSVFPPNWKMT